MQKDYRTPDSSGGSMMVREMRAKWLWTNATVMILGLWLVSSPATFRYSSVEMWWSDIGSGVLLFCFAGIALIPRWDFLGRWTVAVVGTWLQCAPLIFWAPDAAAYLNDTLVGAAAITLSILVPMMPGMAHHMEMQKEGPVIPPGWSYNPSSWQQRSPMIALAFLGWMFSRYLAAYQLGYTPTVWEPFFGRGTVRVLTSDVSKSWPVSDAGLGAAAYTLEFLMAWMGGVTRWRTMPWMVTFFFILVVPLGVTSIILVILQPLSVGYWCSVCLLTALLMLAMIPLTVDEVFATGQFLKQSVKAGNSFWRVFWIGGTLGEKNRDTRSPSYGAPLREMVPATAWGVTLPWNLLLASAAGLWLMCAPSVFSSTGSAADSDRLFGALVVTVSVIVTAEVIRTGRYLNLLLGAWIALSPWLLNGAPGPARWNGLATGVTIILLSIPRGRIRERYGDWSRMMR